MPTILVVRFSSLGDIVLTEPIIRQLRQVHPGSEIHYLTKSRFGELLSMFDGVKRVHLWDSDATGQALIKELRSVDFDLAVDLHDNLRSHRIRSAVGGEWIKSRKEWFKRFASVRMKWLHTKPSHAVDRYACALKAVGKDIAVDEPRLTLIDEDRHRWTEAKLRFKVSCEFYVIAAGAAHEAKRAPNELWVEVARLVFNRRGLRALIVGAPGESGILSELRAQLGPNSIGVMCDESIGLSAAAVADAQFVLSNDSGVAHLAAALAKPVLALFGPTHPILGFAPRGKHAASYSVNEYCSPCSLHGKRPCHREQRYCFTKMDAAKIAEQITILASKEAKDS